MAYGTGGHSPSDRGDHGRWDRVCETAGMACGTGGNSPLDRGGHGR